jgi:hypothetical protein
MKVAFCLAVLLSVVLAQSPAVNNFDSCLKQVKTVTRDALATAQLGLKETWLDMVEKLLNTGADAIQTYEDCKAVALPDVMMWIDQHASPAQEKCLSDAIKTLMDFGNAKKHMEAKADKATILADWAEVVGDLDTFTNDCFLE